MEDKEEFGRKRRTWKKKKNLVVYNLPVLKREEARERYREDEEACRIIFEEGVGVEQVEQKQLIGLEKKEEKKTTG